MHAKAEAAGAAKRQAERVEFYQKEAEARRLELAARALEVEGAQKRIVELEVRRGGRERNTSATAQLRWLN